MIEKLSYGITVLVETISDRKLNKMIDKLKESIQKFYNTYDFYPQYIEDINEYCKRSTNTIKKHILLDYYPTNKLYTITSFMDAYNYINKIFDNMIENDTDLDNMIEQDFFYNEGFYN